jgi:hypothetical protein
MADLFQHHSIEWEYVPLSNDSNAYSTSEVTNCIHEVAINRTDMCWFDSWLLGERPAGSGRIELAHRCRVFASVPSSRGILLSEQTLAWR